MHDVKNFLLAWISGVSTIYATFEAKAFSAFISAVLLPVLFFAAGKAIDVCLQVYFKRREEKGKVENE
jgi:hypothetical protein